MSVQTAAASAAKLREHDRLRRALRHGGLLAGTGVLGVMILGAVLAPLFAPTTRMARTSATGS